MIIIAHRGNVNGPSEYENLPEHVNKSLNKYNVEIDVWFINGDLYLGHDKPLYKINFDYLLNDKLWCHAKNVEALEYMIRMDVKNYFWHQEDQYTLTSSGYIWTYPGNKLTSKSIAVMPETKPFENIEISYGICTDFINLLNQV